jgi:hypothetical protein
MNNLAERITDMRTERLKLRRAAFKMLRENKDLIKNHKLLRKMKYNWMSDLSDLALITYIKNLMETKHYEI